MKKNQAFNLFFQSDLTQQQIADMLDINRKTLYTWIRQGNWKRARHTARHAPTLLVQQYYDQLASLNDLIATRTENPYPTAEEANIIRKLSMVIKHVRTSWSPNDMMDIFSMFTSSLVRQGKQKQAAEMMPLIDEFVQTTSEKGRNYEPLHKYYEGLEEDNDYEQWLAQQSDNAVPEPFDGAGEMPYAPSHKSDESSTKGQEAYTTPHTPLVAPEQSKNRAEVRSDRVKMGLTSHATEKHKLLTNNQSQNGTEHTPP